MWLGAFQIDVSESAISIRDQWTSPAVAVGVLLARDIVCHNNRSGISEIALLP